MHLLKKHLLLSILSIVLIVSCSDDDSDIDNPESGLVLEASYKIDVPEPSGLAINSAGNELFTVSDHTAEVYKLSTTGDLIQTFSYKGNDLEGVSVYKDDKLLLAEERLKEIVVFDMSNSMVENHRISYQNNEENSGIEGVAYNAHDGSIFILNEKNPGLMMRLRSDFSIIKTYVLNFASDYSGIFYDKDLNVLWILSDQNKTINKCNLKGGLLESYSVNVTQAEGIAITKDKIYVISDAEAKLYVYKKPQQ